MRRDESLSSIKPRRRFLPDDEEDADLHGTTTTISLSFHCAAFDVKSSNDFGFFITGDLLAGKLRYDYFWHVPEDAAVCMGKKTPKLDAFLQPGGGRRWRKSSLIA